MPIDVQQIVVMNNDKYVLNDLSASVWTIGIAHSIQSLPPVRTTLSRSIDNSRSLKPEGRNSPAEVIHPHRGTFQRRSQ